MENLNVYNQVREVPREALKEIQAGRLRGKSDINPMWRLKKLTELFGPCGIGWKYNITKQWLEPGGKEEIAAFVNIELFIKVDGKWSDAIPGTGGSSFVANERNGLYTSDECFKMALTDAISVSCKALGFGADVYWNADATKYNNNSGENAPNKEVINKSYENGLEDIREKLCKTKSEFMEGLSKMLKRTITSYNALTNDEAKALIDTLSDIFKKEAG